MNVGEIRTLTAAFAEDPNMQKFTAAKYLDAINKANSQFAMDSKALYKPQAYVMAIGTSEYNLPPDYMMERGGTLNGLELLPISRSELNAKYRTTRWDTIVGTPIYFVTDPMESKKKFIIFPIPNSISDGTDLALIYVPFPATLTLDGDIPLNSSLLMVQFHTALAAYAAWLLLGFITQTPEITTKRNGLLSQYTEKVTEAIQTFGDTKSAPISFHPANIRVR